MTPTDADLKQILTTTKRIAVVGFSMNEARPSYRVSQFLIEKGYEVIPVNPGHAGKSVLGTTVVGQLSEIEGDVDMIDVFRSSEHVLALTEDALAVFPKLKVIWMQLGVENEAAAALARARGVSVVMNRCPKIEHPRLFVD